MTTTDIVKAQPRSGALSLATMTAQEAWRFSEALAGATLLPGEYRGNPGSVLWALEYGRALGLDVVTTITTIHVIKGKPTQSADLMLSRAREAGHRVRIKSDRQRCVVSIVRHDDPDDENVIEWTLEDAKTALLYPGKPDSNWAKYPRAMLRARAIAECVRAACPEVLHGAIYTAEELGARVDDAGLPVDAEVQQLRRVQPGEADPWSAPAPQTAAQGRDYLHEAYEAADADAVRRIWLEARADGAVPEYLEQIAAVGREKTATPSPAPEPGADDEVVQGEVLPEDDYANAVADLRAAAEDARLDMDTFETDAATALGTALADAPTDAIRALAATLRNAA
ncbi:recombinase RecT [Streptomyces sp. NBC_00441]|uniref:recombinase RecT n=1 Tax=Streptomyces sp. NBC_00441 TaxID=2975742 RepID=UPI002E2CD93C|nr:recombinase RecT [Streptomyces sp. NBC_00441]